MFRWMAAALIWVVSVCSSAQEPASRLLIENTAIVDIATGELKENSWVLIENSQISQIGRGEAPSFKGEVRRFNAENKFMIPGLWDMHVHLGSPGAYALPLMIANGITGVREMGGDFDEIKAMRERVESGDLLGPRIIACGPILESPRFVARLAEMTSEDVSKTRIGVGRPSEIPGVFDQLQSIGVDFIKIRNAANKTTYLKIAEEAKRRGLALTGHIPPGVKPAEASDAGQKSIEHGFIPALDHMSEAERAALADKFAQNGTYVCPTIIAGRGFRLMTDEEVETILHDTEGKIDPRRPFASVEMIKFWREQQAMKAQESPIFDWKAIFASNNRDFAMMHRRGVKMLAGSDLGAPLVYPGFSLHDELELFVSELKMTPAEALRCATLNAAEFFELQNEFGTIEEGKRADLVLLDANPLKNIKNTQMIYAVILRGKLIGKSELEAIRLNTTTMLAAEN